MAAREHGGTPAAPQTMIISAVAAGGVLGAGALGGFTTFSAYAVDADRLPAGPAPLGGWVVHR